MASPEEIEINRSKQIDLIEQFRAYYGEKDKGATEITSETLVSHHDTTIRFTNSTTSVMKPYLSGLRKLDQTLYLAQPAMGQQGLYYWQRDGVFGPYASYFASLGSLHVPKSEGRGAALDMQALAVRWNLPVDQLSFAVHDSDSDLLPALRETDVEVVVKSGEADSFRHTYGIEGIVGRNANLLARTYDGTVRTLGNLTLIHTNSDVLGYEVSFDSTTATSIVENLTHPVQAHTSRVTKVRDIETAATDMLSVSSALLAEGMAPVSRGRAGVLRKFMLEYVRLSRDELNFGVADAQTLLANAVKAESLFRAAMSPPSDEAGLRSLGADALNSWVQTSYEKG